MPVISIALPAFIFSDAYAAARRTRYSVGEAPTTYLDFENWSHLTDFMMRGLKIGPYAPQKN
jgi:hypothetical protein